MGELISDKPNCRRESRKLIYVQVALVADCVFISACVKLGFGRPLSQFNFDNLEIFLILSNFAGSFSILAALWSKTSFALTVLRISSGWVKIVVVGIILTVNIVLGGAVFLTWGQCLPVEKLWRPWVPGICMSKWIQVRYNIFANCQFSLPDELERTVANRCAVYSGIMDIVLALFPWKIIAGLTMNRKEKFGVLVAMSMGVL